MLSESHSKIIYGFVKFNKAFLRKNEKRAVFLREKISENRPKIAFHQSDSVQ